MKYGELEGTDDAVPSSCRLSPDSEASGGELFRLFREETTIHTFIHVFSALHLKIQAKPRPSRPSLPHVKQSAAITLYTVYNAVMQCENAALNTWHTGADATPLRSLTQRYYLVFS